MVKIILCRIFCIALILHSKLKNPPVVLKNADYQSLYPGSKVGGGRDYGWRHFAKGTPKRMRDAWKEAL